MRKRTLLFVGLTMLLCGCTEKKVETKKAEIINVKTIEVVAQNVVDGESYIGTIEEESGADLSFASAGTIKSLNINEGQSISAGQLLGTLDSTSVTNAVIMAEAVTAQAQESVNQAEDAYNRMKQLHDNGSLTEMQWVEVQTKVSQAQQLLRQAQASETIARKGTVDTRLTAPFAGYISKKNVEVGQNVVPGFAVARLVKLDNVKVVISVPEDEISSIQIGQKLQFTVSSLGGQAFTATIKEKDVIADPISRSYKVKALIQNTNHQLLPGMICDAYIVKGNSPMAISIPANIVQIDIDNKPFVWTERNGKAKKNYITLGNNVGNNVIVESGLLQGERLIIKGQQKVYNGAKVSENK